MKAITLDIFNKCKHGLYLFSIFLLLLLCGLIFFHAPGESTHMPLLSALLPTWQIALLTLSGAVLLSAAVLLAYHFIQKRNEQKQRLILAGMALACILLQFALLFSIRASLRYDHLMVFDQALEIFRTGKISLSYGENYFGQYPFNIPITLINYGLLNIIKLLGIPESGYMLAIQSVYLLGTDLAVFFSYKIIKILRSQKAAALFALICFVNPLLYMYGFGCYTTILMLPFLMGNLLLFICMLKEKKPIKKLAMAFFLGILFVAGIKVRANLLITLITFVGYLIIHVRNPYTFLEKKKQVLSLGLAIAIGALICYGGYSAIEHHYVKEDYTDMQMPVSYYFLFSSRLESLGSYNLEDHEFIQQFETTDERSKEAWKALFARIQENGLSGNAFLADYKLSFTWSDGVDDYAEFIHTTEHYGTLHDFIGGSRLDFFALYCHMYHVMTLAFLVYSVFLALKRRCNTPFYMIYLNLLGAILFHLLWEAGWAYSISFTLLLLILSADGMYCLGEQLEEGFRTHARQIKKGVLIVPLIGGAVMISIAAQHGKSLFTFPYKQMEYAAVQDMSLGEDLLPLTAGETITQTFTASRPFDHAGCKVTNLTGTKNSSVYRIDVMDMAGNLIGSRTFQGAEVMNKDYVYLKFDSVVPSGPTKYQLQITALETDADNELTFLYYNSGNWDIYSGGHMEGLNSTEKSDLTFVVYDSVTKCFLN